MAHFTETTPFGPYNNNSGADTRVLATNVGSGTIELQYLVGDNWVVHETYSEDVLKTVNVAGLTWQVVVSGDAEFDWS
jgi:hypothetical protein